MIWATQTVFTSRIKVDKLVSASNLGILTWFKWLILPANISFPDLRCRQVGNPMTPQRCRDLMHQLHLQAMGSQAQSRKSETKTFLNQFLRFTFIAICGRTYVFFYPSSLFGYQCLYIQHISWLGRQRNHPSPVEISTEWDWDIRWSWWHQPDHFSGPIKTAFNIQKQHKTTTHPYHMLHGYSLIVDLVAITLW